VKTINGKIYPLWSQFIERENEFIGKPLESYEMGKVLQTKIVGIELKPNGSDSAFFSIKGEDFTCGFDVGHGGIIGGEEGWLTFSGFQDHVFRVKAPNKKVQCEPRLRDIDDCECFDDETMASDCLWSPGDR
jgi:hypothetical protein